MRTIAALPVALLAAVLLVAAPSAAAPVDTTVVVRVQSHDAKFIGSLVGGMDVVIEHADSGEVLASGRIEGGTGDTDRLVRSPPARGAPRADEGDAAFTAALALDRPTRIRVRATGPLGQPQAVQDVEVTTWVVPGRAIDGDGIVLRLPGLIVTPEPQPVDERTIPLTVDVTLMCGCPLTRGGLWDADDYEVRASVVAHDGDTREAALEFSGTANRYTGSLTVPDSGSYQVTAWAHNAGTGNTGVARWSVEVP